MKCDCERLTPRSRGHWKGRFDQASLKVGPRDSSMERVDDALSMIERLSSGQIHLDLAPRSEHEQQYAIRRSGRLPIAPDRGP
jgi:hypothetical protein